VVTKEQEAPERWLIDDEGGGFFCGTVSSKESGNEGVGSGEACDGVQRG
jgi:hypothetical protein